MLLDPYQHSWAVISMSLRHVPWCTSPGSRPPPWSTSPSSTPPSRSMALSPSSLLAEASLFGRGEDRRARRRRRRRKRKRSPLQLQEMRLLPSCVPRLRCGVGWLKKGDLCLGFCWYGHTYIHTRQSTPRRSDGCSNNLCGTFHRGHVTTRAWAQLSLRREFMALGLTRGRSPRRPRGPRRYVHPWGSTRDTLVIGVGGDFRIMHFFIISFILFLDGCCLIISRHFFLPLVLSSRLSENKLIHESWLWPA